MRRKSSLKRIHVFGTAWFILCVSYILTVALRQAGVHWWVVFSLSGHGALLLFLLISLYLFAIFREISGSQKEQIEHPLTSTNYYMMFYVTVPFLGCLAGCLGMLGENTISRFLLGIAFGTLATTFSVWVIVDPVIGLLEMLLPASRRHRLCRLAELKAQQEKRKQLRELLLADVLAKEQSDRRYWQDILMPSALELADLLLTDEIDFKKAELEAIDIGVNAWQLGGLGCMQELRDIAVGICRQKRQNVPFVDFIPAWWDGIGRWRNPSVYAG